MDSAFPVSRDAYAGHYQPASLHANSQQIWQQHRRTGLQPVGTQAYTETVPHPSPNEAWKHQVETLSHIIMRQEGHFRGLEDKVKTGEREIQRLGYLAEARSQHIQRLEHQLAQTEAKNQQLAHEVLVLRHTAQPGVMHAKLPPIAHGNCVPTQKRAQERALKDLKEGGHGSQPSIKSEMGEEESS
ncbi:hypothetical protein ACQKWADRAFT_324723 [Trichoderma austrokoningii]